MKVGAHILVVAATRFYLPLIVLFAVGLLVAKPAGAGVGLTAGLVLGLAFALHLLAFGAAAAARAFPPFLARLMLAFGMIATVAGAAISGAPYAVELAEAGLFVVTASGLALILLVLAGRAPTLRDEAL